MSEPRILRIYLEPVMLQMARDGTFGFADKIKAAFEAHDFRVDFVRDTEEERLKSIGRRGYALFHMKEPFHDKALSMRKAYYFPFWRIENTEKRWEFEIASKPFDQGGIDTDLAHDWAARWSRYLFRKGPMNAERTGMIYVPLQGKLLEHRSFQSMSPVNMIAEVQARAGDRRIVLGLHPGETYAPDEIAAVEKVAAADPRVTLQTGGMEDALRTCDLVVTENSTAALSGLFYRKPAVLFAKTDFHHVMPQVGPMDADDAFAAAETEPPYDEYLYWFIQLGAIKADTDEATGQIIETCRRHGWDI